MDYETRRLDHLGIVAGICDRIHLVEQVDTFFPKNTRAVSPGLAVKAMILNALGFVSRPLYLTEEFFLNKPIELLFRPGMEASQFNDDALGRALDDLFQVDLTSIFAKTSQHAFKIFAVFEDKPCEFYHLDTSSFSFYGQYLTENTQNQVAETNEPVAINITQGYSKDQHPDLKQAVVALICTYKSTLPSWFEALDGNSSDKKSFPGIIERFVQQINDSREACFVVDCALYTEKNIQQLVGAYWLTRIPETIKEAKQFLQETQVHEWKPTAFDGYSLHEKMSNYGGIEHRWIIVYSEKAYKREWKSFEKKLKQAKESAEQELKKLEKQKFNCKEDARKKLLELEKNWKYHRVVAIEYEEVHLFNGKGRPKKDAIPTAIEWKIKAKLEENQTAIEEVKQSIGKFVLATNVSREKLSAEQALETYKAQGSSVERGFRFLKDPLFFASGMYLQKPSRVMALLMVMTLSLLVYSLAERELRKQLTEHQDSVPDQKGKPTQKITLRRVFQMFEGIDVLYIPVGRGLRQTVLNLKAVHLKILSYLGCEVQKCYSVT